MQDLREHEASNPGMMPGNECNSSGSEATCNENTNLDESSSNEATQSSSVSAEETDE